MDIMVSSPLGETWKSSITLFRFLDFWMYGQFNICPYKDLYKKISFSGLQGKLVNMLIGKKKSLIFTFHHTLQSRSVKELGFKHLNYLANNKI